MVRSQWRNSWEKNARRGVLQALGVAALLSASCTCQQHTEAGLEPPASEVVNAFFGAVHADSCAALAPYLVEQLLNSLDEAECAHLRNHFRARQLKRIVSEGPDARQPTIQLVRAQLGNGSEVVFQIVREAGAWRIVRM